MLGGFGAAAALASVLRAEFFGLSPFDPVSYAAAVALLLATSVTAAALPIRRAMHVDPVSSLRSE